MNTKPNSKFVFSVILLCAFLEYHVYLAAATISENKSLSGDQTIVSAGRIFELGFFKPGNLSNFYIGIWYTDRVVSERTIVWVANREKPVSDIFSSVLMISDGNLVLLNESKELIWSTNLTSSSSATALLLDTGNLVLRAGCSNNLSELLWQSFDHPTHTWLPGGRIGFNNVTKQTQILTSWKSSKDPAPGLFSLELDPNGSSAFFIMWNRSRQNWTSGSWDAKLRVFRLVSTGFNTKIYNLSYVTNATESYFTYSVYDPSRISRFVMLTSGQIQQLTWMENSTQWICCNEVSPLACNCLKGFEPKVKRDWDLKDYSGGCSRKTDLHCGNATSASGKPERFLELPSMSLPKNNYAMEVGSIAECELFCLRSCSCTAFAYDSSGCSIWNGELLDLQQPTSTSEFESSQSNKGLNVGVVIAIVSIITGLLVVIFGYYLLKRNGEKNDAELPIFGLRAIIAATNNFAEANKLGEGGFGPVYKGILGENQEVAIKRLSKKSGQGQQEFMNELKPIAKLQHTNLVRLLGCCLEDEEMILIYEYMPNRSLDKLLFDASEKGELDWGRRFQIIEGIAQGVLYIHKYSRLKIIHRDLKASNILLDGDLNPKISDFGMARIFGMNQTEANTNRVVGTYGYMSPEYARYGHFSEKLDVFNFGVLLLEIVSGKKNAAFYRFEHSPTLAGWAWEMWKAGRGTEVIDESVRETCRLDEALKCIHLGFLCVQETPVDRPTMSSIIRMLQGNESTSLPPSKEPAFSTHRNSSHVHSSETPTIFSQNTLTMSLPEGR
ncbi:receptor-like serine/threonine-protein kinase SD1-8 [Pyrus ussuriensis x Pyrus communis]|uniref:Receptor-like serine/threonine-protein kinase n=1 Tax=Pyrus ussuriensis x Pyrus communis TaxID=2448454 RepID=A0A5N5H3B9_9ROSA|nr:receptor-like serine/threonine-protein kinase SD1-8 [Pyrus ussuriensis x Pyrus communis]